MENLNHPCLSKNIFAVVNVINVIKNFENCDLIFQSKQIKLTLYVLVQYFILNMTHVGQSM
jgi:hypothetical protein